MQIQVGNPCSDDHLRKMRDEIYPATPNNVQSDESWEHVKANWRRDEAWLTAEYNKLKSWNP